MKLYLLPIIFIGLFTSCSRTKEENKNLEIVVRAFSSNLYTNYHLYSDRERKDNTGKFKGTWPRTIRVDNPHAAAKRKREKRKNKEKIIQKN
jgi:hypothetical protein